MSILGRSPNNIITFNAKIATELQDINSATLIEYLMNLPLPLPEKTIFTKKKVGEILRWASPREINKAIANLEKRGILERLNNSEGWILNIQNLEKFIEEVGGQG